MTFLTLAQGLGFTGGYPERSTLTQAGYMKWHNGDKQLLRLDEYNISYNGKELCKLDFHTKDLNVGQSVGILLTEERDLHWFVDDQWRGVVHVDDYSLYKPMWGVVDVYGNCKRIRAGICTGES